MSPRRATSRAKRSAPIVIRERSTPRVPLLDSTPFIMQVRCGPQDEIRQALRDLLFPPPKKAWWERIGFKKEPTWATLILRRS